MRRCVVRDASSSGGAGIRGQSVPESPIRLPLLELRISNAPPGGQCHPAVALGRHGAGSARPLRRRRRAAVTAQAARVGAARRGHESTPAAGGAICAVHASGGEGEGGEWGERRRAREGESEGEGEGVGEGERARVWARGTEERERMQRARGRKLGTVVRA